MKPNRVMLAALVIMLLLTSCASQSYDNFAAGSEFVGAPEAPMEESDSAGNNSLDTAGGISIADSTEVNLTERVVIKNATIGIIVDDPADVLIRIGKMAEDSGGFIVNSNLYRTQTDQGLEIPGAEITVRVPAELLVDTLDQIKSLLEDVDKDVRYENITGEDVTSDYTDLQSRLRNLEDAKVKLEEIMESAVKTEDVLAVYNELNQVNEQIEVLKGKIQYYDEASRLSSIAVTITARESIKELSIGGWQPAGVARDAVQALIDTLQFLANAAIWIGLYILPVGLCILIPLFLIYLVVRVILQRRRAKKESNESSSGKQLSEEEPQNDQNPPS